MTCYSTIVITTSGSNTVNQQTITIPNTAQQINFTISGGIDSLTPPQVDEAQKKIEDFDRAMKGVG